MNEFVKQILTQDLKVFNQDKKQESPSDDKLLEIEDEIDGEKLNHRNQNNSASSKQEKKVVEQSLKILKVLDFLYSH